MVERNNFDKATLQAMFNKTRYLDTAIRLIKPAPSNKPKNWQAYRARFVEPVRITGGVDFWNEHEIALARAQEQYGVPAEIIVAIIGVETVYGRNTGNFRVIDSLTTLAFDYPDTPNREARMAFSAANWKTRCCLHANRTSIRSRCSAPMPAPSAGRNSCPAAFVSMRSISTATARSICATLRWMPSAASPIS